MTGALLDRPAAVARARALNRFSLAWNVIEAGVALAAGIAAGSISLVGFGLDSVVEVSASVALAWRLAKEGKGCTQPDDRRATRLVALSLRGPRPSTWRWRRPVTSSAGHHPEASVDRRRPRRRLPAGDALAGPGQAPGRSRARAPRPRPPRPTRPRCARCSRPCSSSGLRRQRRPRLVVGRRRGRRSGSRRSPPGPPCTTWRAESLADTCCH